MSFKVVLGLGNTGPKYKNTYHNVGQLMVDFLIKENFFSSKTIIAKNDGFMNESGNSALKLLKKTGAKPEELLVIQDDSDILLGDFKLSVNRSSAGHKGIQDIIDKISSKNFWRLRIGIRPPVEANPPSPNARLRRAKAEEFVLKKIKKEDLEILQKVFEQASQSII